MANTGKIALVTGANDGIGYEVARQLAEQEGFTVYVGARNEEKGKAAVDKIIQNTKNEKVYFVHLEVTSQSSVTAAANLISDKHGLLDILVDNAGIGHVDKYQQQLAPNLDIHLVRDCMETNFYGSISVCQTFTPLLKKSTLPVIVHVSTGMASTTRQAQPGSSFHIIAYNSSKAAFNSYLVSLSHSFPEAKINSVAPGYTATKLNNFSGPKSPAAAAAVLMKYALVDKDGPTCKHFDENGECPW